MRPQILFLQEVVGSNPALHKKNQIPHESQFEFLADTIWTHHSYGQNASFPDRHHGNAILSDYEILRTENFDISTNRWERRGLQSALINIEGRVLSAHNTHLDLLERGRGIQLTRIVGRIQEFSENRSPLILAGDFNDWTQAGHRQLREQTDLQEVCEVAYGQVLPSFPSFFPLLCLDRIYFRGLRVHSVQRLEGLPWSGLSDHLPLMVDFIWEEER